MKHLRKFQNKLYRNISILAQFERTAFDYMHQPRKSVTHNPLFCWFWPETEQNSKKQSRLMTGEIILILISLNDMFNGYIYLL